MHENVVLSWSVHRPHENFYLKTMRLNGKLFIEYNTVIRGWKQINKSACSSKQQVDFVSHKLQAIKFMCEYSDRASGYLLTREKISRSKEK